MFKAKEFFYLLLMAILISCAPTVARIDPTMCLPDDCGKEFIPPVCKPAYDASIPRVAVVNFTNNSTFDYAKTIQSSVQGASQRTKVGGAAVGVVPGAAGVVWGEKEKRQYAEDSQRTERDINAKLAESVEDGVTDEIVRLGGAKVFTRTELKKVMEEHKFQSSGLADENTLINFGKLAGVKYIITGSINNVNLRWVSMQALKEGMQKHLGLAGSILAAGAESQEGWNIETDISLRIIDVETGEVVFSKIVKGKEIIGKIPYPNYDALIGGIKKAGSKAIADIRPELSRWFTIRGYILQTKLTPDGKGKVALVNVGRKQGIKEDMSLYVYTFQEIEDPLTGKKTCDKVKLPVVLRPTNQIQDDKSWFLSEGEEISLKRVKPGQLVERSEISGQSFMQRMGY